MKYKNCIESKTLIGREDLFVLFSCQLKYINRMKIQMKKWKLLLGTALVSAALLGCAKTNQPSSPEEAKKAQTVAIGYTQFPTNIDPADEYNGWFTVRYGVGETLFKMDDQLEPQPWLAEKIEHPSQLEWKITLRNDVTFQNGEKMTGAKVEASLKRLIEKSKRAADDLGVESIQSDGQTVTIKTKLEQPIMKNLLAEPYSVIVDVDGKAASDKSPVGTGPFLIKTYTPETGATLEAYENYWGGKAKVAQVQIKYFSDPTAISAALQSKEVDAVYGLPYANLASFKKDSQYKISEKEGGRYLSYVYNFEDPYVADDQFRQALDTLVDKKTYTESLFKGAAVPATGPLPSSSDFALDKSVHEFNVEKAKKLLDEAGYKDTDGDGYREKDGKKVTIELLSFTRLPEMPLAIEASQQQLKEVGIEAKIRKVEVSAVATEKNYAFTPYAVVAAPIGDPYAYFNSAVKTGGVGNIGHYSNAEADKKIEELATETDQKKRIQLSKDIQALMDKDHGYTIIGFYKVAIVMNKSISHLESHSTDYYHVTNKLSKE